MSEFHGDLNGRGLKFAIVASRFNDYITERLVTGAQHCLREHGVAEADIDVWWVPGALEIPALVARLAEDKRYSGIVCAGCVIKGDTDHYDFVAGEAMRGVSEVALVGGVAIGNAILTVHDPQQAVERSAKEHQNNKGWEAASAALIMTNHFRRLDSAKS
ncbi:MAG: 6,7-dimethyl-8-ribityllumazine synthase [Candidatus Sumerlaeaceae bacterium]|nr:6,7-dimethyl-8-ribityllumazine synthase [Candidatus Sumerlaeaceae bacterium]